MKHLGSLPHRMDAPDRHNGQRYKQTNEQTDRQTDEETPLFVVLASVRLLNVV